MEEAAQVVPCSSQLDSEDTTQALLKTFAWVEPPEDGTSLCRILAEPPRHKPEQRLHGKGQKNNYPAIEIIPGEFVPRCTSCLLRN